MPFETELEEQLPRKAYFKVGGSVNKTILKREIPTDQGIKLFVEGKTDLMPGFLSKKGRKFAAHLTIDREKGKLGFEFAPRKAKAKKSDDDGDDDDTYDEMGDNLDD